MPDAYDGILCIGDPHLATRVPGFRKDEYPRVVLEKLRWCIDHARQQRLMPVILGDLFHFPRDNANWLLVELLLLFREKTLAVAGNHDCNENALNDDDTLSILAAAGHVQLLDRTGPWRGEMNGRPVRIGGTCWGAKLPKEVERDGGEIVVWVAHHDIKFAGYEEQGRIGCREIPGVDLVVNGHIHRPLEDQVCGATTWVNPGNIARVSRSDGSRLRVPSVLRIDIGAGGWTKRMVEVPHRPFEEIFHPEVEAAAVRVTDSLFVKGLAQLEAVKTSGVGLRVFLKENLASFDKAVAKDVWELAEEVLSGDQQSE
jgi:predicted phosphodiesterase